MQQQQDPSSILPLSRHEDIWELCLSGRLLADLLNPKSLCELSTCARKFLDFRKQITNVLHVNYTEGFLKAMEAGRLSELTGLRLLGLREARKEHLPLLAPAFRGVGGLEVFGMAAVMSVVRAIFTEGLTLPARAKLKDLRVFVRKSRFPLGIDETGPPIDYKGFTNLTSLSLRMLENHEKKDLVVPLVESLHQGQFPALKSLELKCYFLDRQAFSRIVDSIRQGGLQQVKCLHVDSHDNLDDHFIDSFLELMPHLERLNLWLYRSTEGKKRLETAAQKYPTLQLVL